MMPFIKALIWYFVSQTLYMTFYVILWYHANHMFFKLNDILAFIVSVCFGTFGAKVWRDVEMKYYIKSRRENGEHIHKL